MRQILQFTRNNWNARATRQKNYYSSNRASTVNLSLVSIPESHKWLSVRANSFETIFLEIFELSLSDIPWIRMQMKP